MGSTHRKKTAARPLEQSGHLIAPQDQTILLVRNLDPAYQRLPGEPEEPPVPMIDRICHNPVSIDQFVGALVALPEHMDGRAQGELVPQHRCHPDGEAPFMQDTRAVSDGLQLPL